MKLLWDLDGTILNTYPAAFDSFNIVHKEQHGKSVEKQEVIQRLKRTSKEAFLHFGITEEYQEKYKKINREQSESESPPFEGIEEILEAAKINVIVTHRAKASTKAALKRWNILDYFDEIVSPDDDGYPRKPDIGAYQYLYDKYGLDWAIGDRALDLIPAKAVGMKTCAMQNPDIEADLHIEAYTIALIDQLRST